MGHLGCDYMSPAHRLLVQHKDEKGLEGLKATTVQGLSEAETELRTPVCDYTHVPDVMREFFFPVLEGREDYSYIPRDGEKGDEEGGKGQACPGSGVTP